MSVQRFSEDEMTKMGQTERKEQKQQAKAPVFQQFAAGGSAVATPEIPYDVEKVRNGSVKSAPKPAEE